MSATTDLEALLQQAAALHRHLCPRQVLGVRMGMLAAEILSIDLPQASKRLLALVETDGCFSDGVSVATGCSMGHRTMRLIDHGKVAMTLVDTKSGRAIRFAPALDVRQRAALYAPDAKSRWHGQLTAYQRMPNEELLVWQDVKPTFDVAAIIGRLGKRALCAVCGEEILNQREVIQDGQRICRSCAGDRYWIPKQ